MIKYRLINLNSFTYYGKTGRKYEAEKGGIINVEEVDQDYFEADKNFVRLSPLVDNKKTQTASPEGEKEIKENIKKRGRRRK